MKHMKMIVGALSIVVLLMVSILVYNRLNGHSNVVILKSSQVKQTSTSKTSTKKSSEDILDKSDQTESSEPAKSDSFAKGMTWQIVPNDLTDSNFGISSETNTSVTYNW